MTSRKRYSIPLPGRAPLELGERTLVMGIINVTPDSFADGGLRFDAGRAVEDGLRLVREGGGDALRLVEEGAAIVDVGGESTRPGADPLGAGEEMRRVLPVVDQLASRA